MLRPLLLLALVLLPALARAAPAPYAAPLPMLAVLEVTAADIKGDVLDPGLLTTVTDALRVKVLERVGSRFKVLTRETMMEMVPPDQVNCFIDKCAAEIGRKLQTQFVVSGTVRLVGGRLVMTLEGYETESGRLMGAQQLAVASEAALLDAVMGRTDFPFDAWFPAPPPPPPPPVREVAAAPAQRPSASGDTDARAPQRLNVAVRAGLGFVTGVVGVGGEWRPGWVGLAVGTGYLPLGFALTFGLPGFATGPFLDLHGTVIGSSPFLTLDRTALLYGATAGWLQRVDDWIVRGGLGLAASTEPLRDQGPLSLELSVGRVF